MAIADLLQNVGTDLDIYMQALKFHKKVTESSCNEIHVTFINACNQDVLHLWGGNIDLQYVEDEYSTITDVCSCMMKNEKAMGEALKRVTKEFQNDDI